MVIEHENEYKTLYMHCSEIYVKAGQKVGKGDVIAAIGDTGWVSGPCLHFELQHGGMSVDPRPFFDMEEHVSVESE